MVVNVVRKLVGWPASRGGPLLGRLAYVIEKSSSAPRSFPEWSDARRRHAWDIYKVGDIVRISLELESKSYPAAPARIVEMRDLDCTDGHKDPRIILVVAWFNTQHDMRR